MKPGKYHSGPHLLKAINLPTVQLPSYKVTIACLSCLSIAQGSHSRKLGRSKGVMSGMWTLWAEKGKGSMWTGKREIRIKGKREPKDWLIHSLDSTTSLTSPKVHTGSGRIVPTTFIPTNASQPYGNHTV